MPEGPIRAATPDDVRAIADIAWADAAPAATAGPTDAFRDYYDHLVRVERVWVGLVDGTVAGFGAAVEGGRSRHLADLYVRKDVQSRGLGRRLLTAVMDEAPRRTTFASGDPRAVPLYVRAGMTALWPNFYLQGDPSALPSPPASVSVEPVTFEVIAELEAAWTGADRSREIAYWRRLPNPRPIRISDAGRPVAVGLVRGRIAGDGDWLNRVTVAPDADPIPALLAAFQSAAASRRIGGSVLGPSPFVRVLLDAGFRIQDRDTFLASDASLLDPTREIVNTGFF